MKKLLALLLAMVMAFTTFAAAIAEAAVESPIGTWYLHYILTEQAAIASTALGMSFTIDIREDGTMSSHYQMGEEETKTSGTWKQDGMTITFTMISGTQIAMISEGVLYLAYEDMNGYLICMQEVPEDVTYVPGPVVAAPTLEQFAGLWDCVVAESGAMQLAMADLGMTMRLMIEDEIVIFYVSANGEENTSLLDAMVLEDQLYLTYEGDVIMTLRLHEDNVLSYTNADGVIYYFQMLDITEYLLETVE